MTPLQRLAKLEWLRLKAATPPRRPQPRKGMDAETEDLAIRRAQMMRGAVMTHDDLCALAVRWLGNAGRCSFVVREPVWHNGSMSEQPDAFGWRSPNDTVLIECKASRSDFLADRAKPFRRYPHFGLGRHRYYLAPNGVIRPDDLPPRWGLIVANGDRCRRVIKASAQLLWPHHYEAAFAWSLLAKLERRAPRLLPDAKLPPWVDEPTEAPGHTSTAKDLRGRLP